MRHVVIYRGETYIRAKDLGIEANSNVIIQNASLAYSPRPAKGFAVDPKKHIKGAA